MVKPAWFRRYRPDQLPAAFDRVVQSWDTANKASELNDFSVCTSWGIKGRDLYLLEVWRRRLDYPDLKRAVLDEHIRWRSDVVLIEDKASGTQLIQELVADGLYAGYKPQGDKVMRMHAQTAAIENGFVHLPQAAPWLAEYLHELAVFPNGRFDDQVDSTAQFLDWCKMAGARTGSTPSTGGATRSCKRSRVQAPAGQGDPIARDRRRQTYCPAFVFGRRMHSIFSVASRCGMVPSETGRQKRNGALKMCWTRPPRSEPAGLGFSPQLRGEWHES
jgi:predicted phage terminase large subunit-like protein